MEIILLYQKVAISIVIEYNKTGHQLDGISLFLEGLSILKVEPTTISEISWLRPNGNMDIDCPHHWEQINSDGVPQ